MSKTLQYWKTVKEKLEANEQLVLLYVFESIGSSPGRQGFKMWLSKNGNMKGSIGGGIMEHKLVELARQLFKQNQRQPMLKKQIHRKDVKSNQSGMICSGEQTIGLYPISTEHLSIVTEIVNALETGKRKQITFDQKGIKTSDEKVVTSYSENPEGWSYKETLENRIPIYIFGAGHVGNALCKVMKMLDFHITLIDNRENLNTFITNGTADQKVAIDYDNITAQIEDPARSYVILMTFGYRTDKQILIQLLDENYKYLGMMGSREKVDQLYNELESEGVDITKLKAIHSPIGFQIKSKTPEEIAISIAAEIIQIKNNS